MRSLFFRSAGVSGPPMAPAPRPAAATAVAATTSRHRDSTVSAGRRFLAACSIASVAWPVHAIPLPAPIVDATAQFNAFDPGQRIQTFGLLDHTFQPIGRLQFFSTGTPAPALRAAADVGPIDNMTGFGTVSGFLRYSFEIAGPDCTGVEGCIAVDIAAAGHAAGLAGEGGGFEAISRWSLRNTSEIMLLGDSVSAFFDGGLGSSGSDEDAFTSNHSIMLHTNREYRVVMEVLARAGTGIFGTGGFGSAEAFVDPIFRFGSGVDPALFAFRFSDGIGNTPAGVDVPEPGALALSMLAGAALLAASSRRRRRS